MNTNNPHDAPLSGDPEENLRMENELLRLKMQAELGGNSFTSPGLDPQIENEFLKNVMAFENSHVNSQPATVFHFLGKPYFKKPGEWAYPKSVTRNGVFYPNSVTEN